MKAITDSSNGQASRFIQKHARLVSFLGALLVFATFIVKEAIRDNLRDLKSSLESAQASFTIRSDNTTLGDKIDQVDSRVETLLSRSNKAEDPVSKKLMQTKDMLYVGMEDNKYSYFELDRITPVVKRMNKREYDEKMQRLTARIEELRLSGNEIVHSFQNTMDADTDPQKEYDEAGQWVIRCRNSRAETLQFVSEILRNANQSIDADDLRIKHYTLLSYFLYTLGWGLALVGRIFGLEGMGVVE